MQPQGYTLPPVDSPGMPPVGGPGAPQAGPVSGPPVGGPVSGPPGSPQQQYAHVQSQPTPPVQPLHSSRQARLITSDGRQFAVAIGSTIIGRGEGAQVRLADVGISRQHARLDFDGTRVVLSDLGSTNGTTVNGNRINAAALQHGDVVQLGTTSLTFRLDG
jgi:pSer/pThr/pTyr-binding forkhead associated (FHA) protein